MLTISEACQITGCEYITKYDCGCTTLYVCRAVRSIIVSRKNFSLLEELQDATPEESYFFGGRIFRAAHWLRVDKDATAFLLQDTIRLLDACPAIPDILACRAELALEVLCARSPLMYDTAVDMSLCMEDAICSIWRRSDRRVLTWMLRYRIIHPAPVGRGLVADNEYIRQALCKASKNLACCTQAVYCLCAKWVQTDADSLDNTRLRECLSRRTFLEDALRIAGKNANRAAVAWMAKYSGPIVFNWVISCWTQRASVLPRRTQCTGFLAVVRVLLEYNYVFSQECITNIESFLSTVDRKVALARFGIYGNICLWRKCRFLGSRLCSKYQGICARLLQRKIGMDRHSADIVVLMLGFPLNSLW